jgi:putative tricarboxylic transport membrane protein
MGRMMTKKTVDYIILVFCAVIAVLLYRSTAFYPKVSQNSTANYVRFLALSMGILSILQIYFSSRKNDSGKAEFYTNRKKFFSLVALLIVYISIIAFLGFMLSTAIFLPVTMYFMGHRKKRVILVSSIGLLLFLQVLFVTILHVPLPRGMIFGY